MSKPKDSVSRTLMIALGVCLVCSLLVSTAAVTLSSRTKENMRLDKIKNILRAGDLMGEKIDVAKTYEEKVEPVLIDLNSGNIMPQDQYTEDLNPETFNVKKIAQDPKYSKDIPSGEDPAQLGRRPQYNVAYLVKDGDALQKVILPVYGKGLWSTLYGFLALNGDLKTVSGITFYEHKETPGLGGEVDNPRWQGLWKGKKALTENGDIKIQVLKGAVEPSNPNANSQIDGLSGATITTRGVDLFVKYWLGDQGFGPFLDKLREGDAQ